MQIQEALSAALVHGLCIRRAAPIGEYYCIKPTKPGEPLLLRRTGKEAPTKSGLPPLYWTPTLSEILACDWILTTGYPTLFFEGGQDMNDELRGLLMEQMQLLHEQSRADAILPGELAELSNAMTSIAGVLLQLK